jgi:hypothetical protein
MREGKKREEALVTKLVYIKYFMGREARKFSYACFIQKISHKGMFE